MTATILHIARAKDWQEAQKNGAYAAPSLATEGFIHASYPRQLMEVANRIFKGQGDLVLLSIDASKVSSAIRDENLEGGQELYPHIYGRLETAAVIDAQPFTPDNDGTFRKPSVAC